VKHKSLIQYCSSDSCNKFARKYGLCRNHFQEAAAALSLRNSKENECDIGKSSTRNDLEPTAETTLLPPHRRPGLKRR
jgi:hypothetical protein